MKVIGKEQRMKQILNNVNGYALPKEMMAIMGASGSGKTSFLNVLASRLALSPGSVLSGDVKVNGRLITSASFGKIAVLFMSRKSLNSNAFSLTLI